MIAPDERRQEILATFDRVWAAHPRLRFAQILANAAWVVDPNYILFYLTDDQVLAGLLMLEERLRARPSRP